MIITLGVQEKQILDIKQKYKQELNVLCKDYEELKEKVKAQHINQVPTPWDKKSKSELDKWLEEIHITINERLEE